MTAAIRRLLAFASFSLLALGSMAQSPEIKTGKPYKLLTSGRQITIKSTKDIKQVMLWTINGNRIIEHKDIHKTSWVVNVPLMQKNFFLMIGMNDGKVYTEKIGLP
jgi:hypothetical protein